MGSCIICGGSADGPVCSIHEEDIAFIFDGNGPEQLTPNRYYRGTVDGFADFGVFVDIGDSVTGLLHRNELDQRLESLDWEVGDTVFVQVQNIRDNGNVDLGWSVRQSIDEFRGTLIDTPDGDRVWEDDDDDDEEESVEEAAIEEATGSVDAGQSTGPNVVAGDGDDVAAASGTAEQPVSEEYERVAIDSLSDRVDEAVRLEGEVIGVRQTSGPTLFELRDESGTIECAAFEAAGVRAFPEIDVGDYVRLDGEVEYRHDDIQVETETILQLAGEERESVAERIADAIDAEVRPQHAVYPVDDDPTVALEDRVLEAATAIRRAIKNSRPVVIRHAATVDGYAAGAALERAVLPRINDEHNRADAQYHYVKRRPLDDPVYGMSSVTADLTSTLETVERHGERKPLMVLVGLGSTEEAVDAFELLDLYDIERIVIDDTRPTDDIETAVQTIANPYLTDEEIPQLTTTAIAAAVAGTVDPSVVEDLGHLPAISYWESTPQVYTTAADAVGYDDDARRQLREALALEAYYQSYNDKRELIQDLLFADVDDLVAHISEQSRERLETGLDPARENLSRKEAAGVTFLVLDTESFTHRFDFPPTELLLDELHRQERSTIEGPVVSLGVGSDELHVRSTVDIDLQAIVDRASDVVPSLTGVGGKDGHVRFLSGVREDAIEAVVGAIAAEVGA